MDTTSFQRTMLNRRTFLAQTAALSVGVIGLAACGGSEPAKTGSTKITATVNTLPPTSNPDAIKIFNDVIKKYEAAHPNVHIVGKNDPYDPTTYFAKVSAGQAQDGIQSYFTEPPVLIQKKAAADITDFAKGWEYYKDYIPSIASICTDQSTNKVYGIPITGYSLTLWYNRKLFKAAGLDPEKPPTTWEELRTYAKQLTSSSVAGFADTSAQNQGGWHFTNWMYSAGGDMESADQTKPTFNSDKGVSVLQLLKDMRFTDNSMTKQQLLTQNETLQLFATGKVAMVIMAPDMLPTLKSQFQAKLEDFGIGPMPQNGGNAALTGGNIFVFNPKSSKEVIKTAFDYVIYAHFDLAAMEQSLADQAKAGQVVGAPANILFTGDFQKKRDAIIAKYANVPLENYKAFTSSTINLRPEPRTQTQKVYAALDTAVQAILTDQKADPKKLLDAAVQQVQQYFK